VTVVKAKKRVTIKDVAAKAGVSHQTVSRVINGKDNVTPKTRTKVEQAIELLNFRPSLAARTLPSRRTHVIGLIIPYEADYFIRDPHILAQISGIDAEANLRGYSLLLSSAGHSRQGIIAYERLLRHQVADGVLVVETAISQVGNGLLARQDIPYVTLGYDNETDQAYSVHCDDYDGGKKATLHLIEQGHTQIGLIHGPTSGAVETSRKRMLGYQDALAQSNLPFQIELITYGDYTRLGGQQATQQLLALAKPPTAIFAMNDRMAMGAIRAIHNTGLRVPDDIAVVGFDDIPAAVDFNPAITSAQQPSKEMGQAAAQLLFKLIEGETVTEREIILPAQLAVRQSS